MGEMGMISARVAFGLFGLIGVLIWFTLDGNYRIYALLAIALFAVKAYIDILRRRIQAREDEERDAAANKNPPAE